MAWRPRMSAHCTLQPILSHFSHGPPRHASAPHYSRCLWSLCETDTRHFLKLFPNLTLFIFLPKLTLLTVPIRMARQNHSVASCIATRLG